MNARRRRRRPLPTEPVSLEIEKLSHEGRGISHIEGKVAFVDGALPGERVQAQYVRKRSQLDELKAVEIELAAADRVDPGCDFAQQCGGCSLRHFHTDKQLQFKESVLLEQLQHAAGLSPADFSLLPRMHGDTRHYRRKARLAVRLVTKKGGALVGFREKYSTFITDMDNCQVLAAEVASLLPILRELITRLSVATQIPQIEVAVGETGPAPDSPGQVALVFRHLQAIPETDMKLLLAFAAEYSVELYLQPAGPQTVHKIYPAGADRLQYFLPEFDLTMQFHPQDFTQVNASINRQAIHRAIELLELQVTDRVLDLFCGLGNFTLPIARSCGSVLGVEGSEEMVVRAGDNARLNQIGNATFASGDLTRPDQDQSWATQSYDKILLDPPRSGALEIIPLIASRGAQKILYVSCNPATLARDAAELLKHGYQLKSAGVMDMFPHTAHVESMAVFTPS
jgi:23S rRNA (uracil1939-C5)-methyltransferase